MVEAQEVEAVLTIAEVHDAGLVGMQTQPESGQHRLDPAAGFLSTLPAGGEHYEIVGVTDQRPQGGRVRPRPIEHCDTALVEGLEPCPPARLR
jgi:hypothetical protein